MANKFQDYEMQEFFIKKTEPKVNNENTVVADSVGKPKAASPSADVATPEVARKYSPSVFEESLAKFSSANVPKRGKRKKRKLGVNGVVRLLALCLCLGLFVLSLGNILARSRDLAAGRDFYDSMQNRSSAIPSMKTLRSYNSMDLLTYLGSAQDGMEMFDALDMDKQEYYEWLRDQYFHYKKINADCWGYIVVSDTRIDYPIMKGINNDQYLYRTPEGKTSKLGSIFADSSLKKNYEDNRNVVIYGHCMTEGSMFRGIKLFFDSANRYTKAQNMEITVVTADAVYVYEYFSGYRSEGDEFARCYSTATSSSQFYKYLKDRRALNTISKEVSYDSKSKIITLVTCTNIPSKPGERYVLHGILKNVYYF